MIDNKRLELFMRTADSMGLKPELVTDYGLVSIQFGDRPRYIFYHSSNPNNQMASWLSKNKHATRIVLQRAGLPNIPFALATSMEAAEDFLAEHGKIIVKPLKGKKSQDIHLVKNHNDLAKLDINQCILEKYIKGQEIRFLVVANEVKAVHLKVYESDINNPDTVQRVSLEQSEWNMDLAKVAQQAAAALDLIFTAVDFLVNEEGAYVLEVNSAPGIDRFQNPDKGPFINIMQMYLELMVRSYNN